jgi:hypothetical protein
MVFAADVVGGTERRQAEEVIDMGFFGPHELPHALLIGQRPRIMDAFAGYEGVCRLEDFGLPFGSLVEREELLRCSPENRNEYSHGYNLARCLNALGFGDVMLTDRFNAEQSNAARQAPAAAMATNREPCIQGLDKEHDA